MSLWPFLTSYCVAVGKPAMADLVPLKRTFLDKGAFTSAVASVFCV